MENLAVLDGMKRDGWSGSVIDRVERALNAHADLLEALKAALHELQMDLPHSKDPIQMIKQAIAKAEGK